MAPVFDTLGARISSSVLLLMGCIPTAFDGLVNSTADVAVIRFFIGVMGATFVCTQFWTSQVFAKEFVGTANATSAGWGNLGGGVTQVRRRRNDQQITVEPPPVAGVTLDVRTLRPA